MLKHQHKIALDKKGNRIMDDYGWWLCKCGASTFPNMSWFPATLKSKKIVKEFMKS